MAGFPADPSKLEFGIAFGADLSADPSGLTYPAVVNSVVQPRVTITRGRVGDSITTQPSTVDIGLYDAGGIYSPRNITSPHYGQLRRNTPLRVRVDPGTGYVRRGTGNVPDWNPTWTGPNMDDRIQFQASGFMRRLGQSRDPVSALRRTTLADNATVTPLAYWPCEDADGSSVVASALPAGSDLTGVPRFRPGDSLTGSAGALDLGQMDLLAVQGEVPISPLGFQIEYTCSFDGGVDVVMFVLSTGNFSSQFGLAPDQADGTTRHQVTQFTKSGSDVAVTSYENGVLVGSGTLPGFAIGTSLIIQMQDDNLAAIGGNTALLSHLTVFDFGSINTPTARAYAARGYQGETAAARVQRLCDENRIVVDVAAGSSEPMGPQPTAAILELLRQCEDSDEGTLLERRDGRLGFDPRSIRYNQSPALTLAYATQVEDLDQLDDDRDLVNDATVTRLGGKSVQYQLTTGPLSIDPVTGVDDYPLQYDRSLAEDSQAIHHASLIVNAATVDEPRYVITINLRQRPELITQWLACDIGSRILVNSPQAIHTGPAPLDLIIAGYVETLDAVQWTVVIYALPYLPYEAYQVQNGSGNRSRIPAPIGGTTVNVQRSATDTSFAITSATVPWIDSATYAAQFPIPVRIAGEVMSCTAIVGTTLSQTMTVTRGVHGVSKVIPAGSEVQLWRAPVVAL